MEHRAAQVMLYAARLLNSTLEYEEMMRQILELTIDVTHSQGALVYRIDPGVGQVRARAKLRDQEDIKYFTLPKGIGIIAWAAEHRQPVTVNDVAADPRYFSGFEHLIGVAFRSVLVVPLIGRGQLIGILEAINKLDGPFDDDDLAILTGLSNVCAVCIDNANLYRQARRVARERELLYEVGQRLSGSLDVHETLRLILDSLRRLLGFDAGGIYLLDHTRAELSAAHSVGYGEHADTFTELKFDRGLVGWVARTGEPVIVPDVSMDERYVPTHPDTQSEIVAPLRVEDQVVGVINLESNRLGGFDQHSLNLLTAFAGHAAIAMERAVLHARLLRAGELKAQLSVARQIQLSFLPKAYLPLTGYDLAGVNIPSGEVGGDYFDYIPIVDSQTGIAIADVSGKGIPAALIMASYRASLIAEIRNNFTIRTICTNVNRLLVDSLEPGSFVTAFYGVLDSRNHVFTFANCGHDYPIWLRGDGQQVEYLREGGVALGIVPGGVYEERPVWLAPGDVVFFYTDGVSEAKNGQGEDFGVQRLVEVLQANRQRTAMEIHGAVYAAVKAFAAPDHVFDDLTMIALKRL